MTKSILQIYFVNCCLKVVLHVRCSSIVVFVCTSQVNWSVEQMSLFLFLVLKNHHICHPYFAINGSYCFLTRVLNSWVFLLSTASKVASFWTVCRPMFRVCWVELKVVHFGEDISTRICHPKQLENKLKVNKIYIVYKVLS